MEDIQVAALLVRRCVAGDAGAWEEIVRRYNRRIYNLCYRFAGKADDAQDLTQEVFIKIGQALPGFRGDASLSTWIYRIAANTACDWLRRPAIRRVSPGGLPEDLETGEACLLENKALAEKAGLTPEQQVFLKQRFECYCDFIADLPPAYRQIVVLRELEELAVGEIADLLGLSLDVVKIRLHRGREKLIRQLKAHCKPEDWL